MAIAQVASVTELDQHSPRHPLARDLQVARRFESILQDGYDPDSISVAPEKSLLAHVAEKSGYKATLKSYTHALWRHLAERTPHWRRRDAWVTAQLTRYGILRVEPVDESHAIELGLFPENPYGEPAESPPLDLHQDRFATLDGLLLLLLLYREAQDAAHTHRATRLKDALYQAAMEFARLHRYDGEILDTWRFLVESRMVAWDPRMQPTSVELGHAYTELRADYMDVIRPRGKRGPIAPEKLKPGTRSERRWRRRVWVRACCMYFDRVWRQPNFDYRDACPVFEWVTAHRALIGAHRARAIDVLMDCDDGSSPQLPPLEMQEALHARRRRPGMSEKEWEVFGDTSIYDVIPVVIKTVR